MTRSKELARKRNLLRAQLIAQGEVNRLNFVTPPYHSSDDELTDENDDVESLYELDPGVRLIRERQYAGRFQPSWKPLSQREGALSSESNSFEASDSYSEDSDSSLDEQDPFNKRTSSDEHYENQNAKDTFVIPYIPEQNNSFNQLIVLDANDLAKNGEINSFLAQKLEGLYENPQTWCMNQQDVLHILSMYGNRTPNSNFSNPSTSTKVRKASSNVNKSSQATENDRFNVDVNLHFTVADKKSKSLNIRKSGRKNIDEDNHNVVPALNLTSSRQRKTFPMDYTNRSRKFESTHDVNDTGRSNYTNQTYRTYTLKDYKKLEPIKELPKTLGPDWIALEDKLKSKHTRDAYAKYVKEKNATMPRSNKLPVNVYGGRKLSRREVGIEYAKSVPAPQAVSDVNQNISTQSFKDLLSRTESKVQSRSTSIRRPYANESEILTTIT